MINQQGAMISYLDDFYLMAIITIIMAPFVFLLKNPKGPVEVVHVGE